jgi:hypothetical protein
MLYLNNEVGIRQPLGVVATATPSRDINSKQLSFKKNIKIILILDRYSLTAN